MIYLCDYNLSNLQELIKHPGQFRVSLHEFFAMNFNSLPSTNLSKPERKPLGPLSLGGIKTKSKRSDLQSYLMKLLEVVGDLASKLKFETFLGAFMRKSAQ